MALKTLEKLGGVAGFIPIVSSITGIIKYFYYKEAKSKGFDKLAITETAQKINSVKGKLNVETQKNKCYENLKKASLIEMIPGVNIFAAIYSAVVLSKLSDIRDINKDPVNQRQYLFKKYNVKSAQHDWMSEALIIVDNLNLQDIKGPIEQIGKYTKKQDTYFIADAVKQSLASMLQGYDANPKTKNANPQKLVKDNLNQLIEDYENRITRHKETLEELNEELTNLADKDRIERRAIIKDLGGNEDSDDGKLSPMAQFTQKNKLIQQTQLNQELKLCEICKDALQIALNTLNESESIK